MLRVKQDTDWSWPRLPLIIEDNTARGKESLIRTERGLYLICFRGLRAPSRSIYRARTLLPESNGINIRPCRHISLGNDEMISSTR